MIEDGIINGKLRAASILEQLKIQVDKAEISVKLAIILVGDNEASAIYVRNKIKAAARVGISSECHNFDINITENEILQKIASLNDNQDISGIIVQLPLPGHIDKTKVAEAIAPHKDVDGLNPANIGLLNSDYSDKMFVPCTALGCLDLIMLAVSESINNKGAIAPRDGIKLLQGMHAVIIGRSNIVGRPLAALLLNNNCTVTNCHSFTKNLADITKKADIVIAATGQARFFTKEYFNSNAIIIDVGISRIEQDGKISLSGDVDFADVRNYVKYITPVPGGVGPMTIAYLLANSFKAAQNQRNGFKK